MSDTQVPIPSLAERVRPVDAGAPVVGIHFLGVTPVFVLGEEALLFAGDDERLVKAHAGAILASACDRKRILTGGDDGNLIETSAGGENHVLASDDK
ncbi:MAG: WD40 repeat domain-containing protein, partial [Pseudolabrys sp.]